MLPLCTSVTLFAPVVKRVLDGGAHEAVCALLANRLDAKACGVGEAHFGITFGEGLAEQLLEALGLFGSFLKLDTGVNVLCVFAKDHHVHQFRLLHRAGDAVKVTNRAHTGIEIQPLAQGDVYAANAAAYRGCQRAFERDHIFIDCVQSFLWQPYDLLVDIVGLVAGIDLHPDDLFLAAVGLGHRGIQHGLAGRPNVGASAIAFNEADNGIVWHL